jgi:hypothetical protein
MAHLDLFGQGKTVALQAVTIPTMMVCEKGKKPTPHRRFERLTVFSSSGFAFPAD